MAFFRRSLIKIFEDMSYFRPNLTYFSLVLIFQVKSEILLPKSWQLLSNDRQIDCNFQVIFGNMIPTFL